MSEHVDSAGAGEPHAAAPISGDQAELARVYAALLARAGETQVETRLDATRRACELLGDVHTAAPVIHLAGTNGKTSTARMVDALLRAHGLRVGRFTSPHLSRVTERISVDGEEVSIEAFARIYDEIAPYLAMVDAQLEEEGRPTLTFFEALTVLAFAVFADAPVDVVVLEAGLGGEWDSTNVADAAVCGFTAVGLDHQRLLGEDIADIAATKAGILDRTCDQTPAPEPIAVIGSQTEEEALEALRAAAESRGVRTAVFGEHFGVLERTRAVDGQVVALRGTAGDYDDLFLPLHGAHQAENAATALAVVECLLTAGERPLAQETVAEAFSAFDSPGRLEVLRAEPAIIADAAHNPAGARALAEAFPEAFGVDDLTIVFGVYADKDVHGILEHLSRIGDRIIVTRPLADRALDVDALAEAAEDWFDADDVIRAADVRAAVGKAVDCALDSGSSSAGVLVTGSISTVAEARILLRKEGA